MRSNSSQFKPALWTALGVFLIFLAYAYIRYAVIKGVSPVHLPLFLNNKAISVAAVTLIALSYAWGSCARFFPSVFAPRMKIRKWLGLFGFGFAALHSLISLLLFSPANYPKFFDQGSQLNLVGELSMLFGVLAFALFSLIAFVSIPSIEADMHPDVWLRVQRSGYAGILLILGHVLVMGFEGWFKPATWPGGLLPMSLVAFSIGTAALLLRAVVLMLPDKKR